MGFYEEKKFRLAYLFLSAGKRISDADYALFEEMCPAEDRGEIIGECEKLLAQDSNGKSRFELVTEAFSETASSRGFRRSYSHGQDDKHKRSALWMFTSLMYQSEGNKQNRQTLIDLWIEHNKINPSIFAEMLDISETVKAVTEYKKYLETSKMPYQEISAMMSELDKSAADLQKNASSLIELG